MPHFFEWFPYSRAEQLAMAIAWNHLFRSSSPPPFGIPPAEVQEFTSLTAKAETTLELAKSGERTPVITAQCREDFERMEDKMRFLKNHYLIGLSDAELASLGLRPHKDRSPVPPPTGFPEADISYPGVHTLDLHPRPVAGQPPLNPRYRLWLPHLLGRDASGRGNGGGGNR